MTPDEGVSGSQSLGATEAIQQAAADVDLRLGELSGVEADGPWQTFESTLSTDLQRARLMAVPTPSDGVRLAWETTIVAADHTDEDGHGHPMAYISFVDAQSGDVLLRDNRVDHLPRV